MKSYIVTVHYALRIEAKDMSEAQRKVERVAAQLVSLDNYITGSFEIPDIHEDAGRNKWA